MNTETLPLKKNIKHFIGVDISKNKLDFAVLSNNNELLLHKVVPNTIPKITLFLDELKTGHKLKKANALFCMENTGIYGMPLIHTLYKAKFMAAVENGYHILHSGGILREKSDKLDAIRLAAYAQLHFEDIKLWKPARPVIAKLMHLSALRERLVGVAVKLKLPLKENKDFIVEALSATAFSHCKRTLQAVSSDVEKIEGTIDKAIAEDAGLDRINKLIMSVPGVGKHTALQIIIRTNEFFTVNDPKKFACYAGVVPFKKESGLKTSKGKLSPIANKKIKSLLHMCAMRAIRSDPEIRAYYLRKVAEQKPKMSVINAIRNKLVLRVFACVNKNKPYAPKNISTIMGH